MLLLDITCILPSYTTSVLPKVNHSVPPITDDIIMITGVIYTTLTLGDDLGAIDLIDLLEQY